MAVHIDVAYPSACTARDRYKTIQNSGDRVFIRGSVGGIKPAASHLLTHPCNGWVGALRAAARGPSPFH